MSFLLSLRRGLGISSGCGTPALAVISSFATLLRPWSEFCPLRLCRGSQAAVVGADVGRFPGRELVVEEKLLNDPVAVGCTPLLVGRDLIAAESLEGTLATCVATAAPHGLRGACRSGSSACEWKSSLYLDGTRIMAALYVALLLVVLAEEFQGLHDIATGSRRSADFRHVAVLAENAFAAPPRAGLPTWLWENKHGTPAAKPLPHCTDRTMSWREQQMIYRLD